MISSTLVPLIKRGIDFIEAEVTGIDTAKREVRFRQQKISYDFLIIALGAEYSPASTPGFNRYAKNLYVESGCAEIRDLLRSLNNGTITILVCGLQTRKTVLSKVFSRDSEVFD
jgi:sulfide:quinone oxidoreductase